MFVVVVGALVYNSMAVLIYCVRCYQRISLFRVPEITDTRGSIYWTTMYTFIKRSDALASTFVSSYYNELGAKPVRSGRIEDNLSLHKCFGVKCHMHMVAQYGTTVGSSI